MDASELTAPLPLWHDAHTPQRHGPCVVMDMMMDSIAVVTRHCFLHCWRVGGGGLQAAAVPACQPLKLELPLATRRVTQPTSVKLNKEGTMVRLFWGINGSGVRLQGRQFTVMAEDKVHSNNIWPATCWVKSLRESRVWIKLSHGQFLFRYGGCFLFSCSEATVYHNTTRSRVDVFCFIK